MGRGHWESEWIITCVQSPGRTVVEGQGVLVLCHEILNAEKHAVSCNITTLLYVDQKILVNTCSPHRCMNIKLMSGRENGDKIKNIMSADFAQGFEMNILCRVAPSAAMR